MKDFRGFWDASAVAPLCVNQASSPATHAYFRKIGLTVWWGTFVEVCSAIYRSRRAGELGPREQDDALNRLNKLNRAWKEVAPSEEVRDLAARMLEQYPLRAGDSLQLAAALAWCGRRPARRSFLCADRRLSDVARAVGFSVIEI